MMRWPPKLRVTEIMLADALLRLMKRAA